MTDTPIIPKDYEFKTKHVVMSMALWEFIDVFPEMWLRLCKDNGFDKFIDASDKEYIIKLDLDTGHIEIGYKNDKWTL